MAGSTEAGLRLAEALRANAGGEAVSWDLPGVQAEAAVRARRQGLAPERSLSRIVLGDGNSAGQAGGRCALTGPETG